MSGELDAAEAAGSPAARTEPVEAVALTLERVFPVSLAERGMAAALTALQALDHAGYAVVPKLHEGRAGLTDIMCAEFWRAFEIAQAKGRGHYESTNAGYNALIRASVVERAKHDNTP